MPVQPCPDANINEIIDQINANEADIQSIDSRVTALESIEHYDVFRVNIDYSIDDTSITSASSGIIIDQTDVIDVRLISGGIITPDMTILDVDIYTYVDATADTLSNDNLYATTWVNGNRSALARQASAANNDGNWSRDTNQVTATVNVDDEITYRKQHLFSPSGGSGTTRTLAIIRSALVKQVV